MPTPRRPHIVIVGAGFGGLSAARELRDAPADVTIIDKRNHHLFQPLLYQVATAALAPNQIASPIRSLVRRHRNMHVVLDEVVGVDRGRRRVVLRNRDIPFDYLIVATGSRHSYFGNDAWEKNAPGLKTLEDATRIREKMLMALERAEVEDDAAERARLLTFVVIGGGPTGVELAGAVAELCKRALARDFRRVRRCRPRVVLLEAGERLLSSFPESLSTYATRSLEKRGIEIRLGQPVVDVTDGAVTAGDEVIAAETIIWAAGVRASPAGEWTGSRVDKAGRVCVNPDLSIEKDPDIFVVGDTASVVDADGNEVPGLAPAAKQQGAYVARLVKSRMAGAKSPLPFKYADYGLLTTISRNSAVVQFRNIRLTGFVAWLFWSIVHIYFLIGFRNRIVLTLDWIWSYVTLERGARLIATELKFDEADPHEGAAPGSESPPRYAERSADRSVPSQN